METKSTSYADTTGCYTENPEVLRLREVNADLVAALTHALATLLRYPAQNTEAIASARAALSRATKD